MTYSSQFTVFWLYLMFTIPRELDHRVTMLIPKCTRECELRIKFTSFGELESSSQILARCEVSAVLWTSHNKLLTWAIFHNPGFNNVFELYLWPSLLISQLLFELENHNHPNSSSHWLKFTISCELDQKLSILNLKLSAHEIVNYISSSHHLVTWRSSSQMLVRFEPGFITES